LRGLRIAPPTQLGLAWDDERVGVAWDALPEATRAAVLSLLARLIAKGVLAEEDGGDG
jgi:hypothetical protein